jgi:hypothetical protein
MEACRRAIDHAFLLSHGERPDRGAAASDGARDNTLDNRRLVQLADEGEHQLDCALAALFVVGRASDATVVEPLLSHRSEPIRKAARTCLFEIRRRAG